MPTKLILAGTSTAPASSTGADSQSADPKGLSGAEFNQVLANLRKTADDALALIGGFQASQTPGANQIPVVKADNTTVLPGSISALGTLHRSATRARFYNSTNTNYAEIYCPGTGGDLVFNDGAGESFRSSSGNLLAGVTSGAYHSFVKNNQNDWAFMIKNSSSVSPYGLIINTAAAPASGQTFLYCTDTGGARFLISGAGNAQNANNSYGGFSDIKLKENIVTARNYLADLCAVNIVKYSLKADNSLVPTHLGVIAQELERIFPGMIEETPDMGERETGRYEQVQLTGPDGTPLFRMELQLVSQPKRSATGEVLYAPGPEPDTYVQIMEDVEVEVPVPIMGDDLTKPIMERYDLGTTTKSVKYSVFTPMLITAVQSLKSRCDDLEARLAIMEAK